MRVQDLITYLERQDPDDNVMLAEWMSEQNGIAWALIDLEPSIGEKPIRPGAVTLHLNKGLRYLLDSAHHRIDGKAGLIKRYWETLERGTAENMEACKYPEALMADLLSNISEEALQAAIEEWEHDNPPIKVSELLRGKKDE